METELSSAPDGPGGLGVLGGYRLLRQIGEGGMAVVFEAEDLRLGRRVALKALAAPAAGAEARHRFLREARLVAALDHDHIVAIHQVGEDRGVPFLIMPLLRGESLEDRLGRYSVLAAGEAARIGREVAAGLAAAHAQGVVHRDVKPSNVWLEEGTDRVKVLDFGLARPVDGDSLLSDPQAIAGTPAYMAPEQVRGGGADFRSDLFSLGCVLYRMCTGTSPFERPTVPATMLAVASEEPPPPARAVPAVPGDLSDLILQLLRKDPAERPLSAGDVADRLSALSTAQPRPAAAAASPRPSVGARSADRPPRWRRRLAAGATAGAVAAAAFLAGAAGGGLVSRGREAPFEAGGFDLPIDAVQRSAAKRGRAEWVLTRGGSVTVPSAAGEHVVRSAADLPADVFPVAADLGGRPVRDEDLDQLAKLTDLRRLAVDGGQLTGAGFAKLDRLQSLRELSVSNVSAGDECVAHLAGFKYLSYLDLSGARLSVVGLQRLGTLAQLRELGLTNAGLDDDGLACLKGLSNLKALRAGGNRITNAGLAALRDMRQLELLDLSGARADDAGLTLVAGLPNLRTLGLNATRVTDASVPTILKCPLLFRLELQGARLSGRGHAALAKVFSPERLPWSEPNRSAAEAVLAAGGTVRFRVKGSPTEQAVSAVAGLPEDCFVLTYVRLARAGGLPADLAAKLAALSDSEFDGLTAAEFASNGLDAAAVDMLLQGLPATVVEVSLAGTQAGDAQLARCAQRLRNLRRLDITGTRVTAAGAAALRSVLANCQVVGLVPSN